MWMRRGSRFTCGFLNLGIILLMTACGGGSSSIATGTATTTLSASVSSLALAVSGVPRKITVTNTGSVTATSVGYTLSPALPAGTSRTSSCGNLAAGSSCELVVTPGATPSATAGDTNPSPIVLTIAGTNTNTLNPSINILGFGSVYQSGYVFAIDDTTPDTGSIGGKVAALVDEIAPGSGIEWSSGTGHFGNILGIYETSINPPAACTGKSDGTCNTQEIVNYFSQIPPAVSLSNYAAGLCRASVQGSVSDWYLPAICEMGFDTGATGTGCGNAGSPAMQNIQTKLVDNANIGGLAGNYWSSTEASINPSILGFSQYFATGGGSFQGAVNKSLLLGVRCARVLTN